MSVKIGLSIMLVCVCTVGLIGVQREGQGYQTLEYKTEVSTYSEDRVVKFVFDTESNQLILTIETFSYSTVRTSHLLPANRKVWKEVYGVVDGRIKLIEKINGRVIPEETIPEHIDWDDKNK